MTVLFTPTALLFALGLASGSEPPASPETRTEVAASANIGRDELLGRMKSMKGLEARYEEEKHIALLAEPLVSRGSVHFAPPRRFARHQIEPFPSTMLVEGNTMSFGDPQGSKRLDLQTNVVVRLFVDGFLDLLSGQTEDLLTLYDMKFESGLQGRPRAWRITLEPKVDPIVHLIERIVLEGEEAVVRRMEVREVGGDATITTFSKVDASHAYSESEAERVFALPTKR